jgi:hypothetical protein
VKSRKEEASEVKKLNVKIGEEVIINKITVCNAMGKA